MTGRSGVYVKPAGAEKCLYAILRRIFWFRWFRLSEPIPDRDMVTHMFALMFEDV
jgi:hypothetical protein